MSMALTTDEQGLIPVGDIGIIALRGCEEMVKKIDNYLLDWHHSRRFRLLLDDNEAGYVNTFQINAVCPRFGTGEGKGLIKETIRGKDLYLICDPFNYGVTYSMYGQTVPMSPDDHFQDLKRVISAIGGKARRLTVIMPMLYEGRQHRRAARESLDCAMALQELVSMGVSNIITFDAHDSRVQNAVPLEGFESISTAYQMIKAMVHNVEDLHIDKEKMLIVSPDEGGMSRSMYFSSVLGLDLGMFYKRRDYSVIVGGRNPIISHDFLGRDVAGKDVIVVDDMISSGDSMLDVAAQLKARNAKRIFVFATFGLFCNGLEKFDEAYTEGIIDKVFTTNLIYITPELAARQWHVTVDMSKYIALIIDTLAYDKSLSVVLNPVERIKKLLKTLE